MRVPLVDFLQFKPFLVRGGQIFQEAGFKLTEVELEIQHFSGVNLNWGAGANFVFLFAGLHFCDG